jgi:hypothetical protein
MVTVESTVIDANPLKTFIANRFATTTAVTGFNVKATGTSVSSWRFNLHYGNMGGEAYDSDPGGDPGYLIWDDSDALVTISGNVYSDEGVTASTVCDGATSNVRLLIQGAGARTATCAAGTGAYSITGVTYNPGDVLTLYLDGTTKRAVTIAADPVTSIANMHLYENRVIVRNEDTGPITIADMNIYDSGDDADIPFTVNIGVPNTLTLPPETELHVWAGKTFVPGGNITLQSGGSGAVYDGRLHIDNSATFTASGTESHSIGGGFQSDAGAVFSSASSTLTFTATTTGKTITGVTEPTFYNLTFNGTGAWTFTTASATTTNNFTIQAGTPTLPSNVLSIGGNFDNSGGTFIASASSTQKFTATAAGKTIRAGGSDFGSLLFDGTGGGFTIQDTNATTTGSVTIAAGTLTHPTGTFAIARSYENTGGAFTHNGGTVQLYSTTTGQTIFPGSSSFYNLTANGTNGAWAFTTADATTTNNFTIQAGTLTAPPNIFAVGGNFANSAVFAHNGGTIKMNAATTGKTITPGASPFANLTLNNSAGGWTITGNATTTGNFTLASSTSFTQNSGTTLEVGGTFTNSVGGAATAWTGSTLYLNSGTSFAANQKTDASDTYDTLKIGANTKVSLWNSSASTVTMNSTGSLYSQNHAAVSGNVNIYGAYTRSSGSDYWSYAKDFDGTAATRQVNVKFASSSSAVFSGGTLEILGTAAATTTIDNQGTGKYALAVSGGTLNAQYYQIRNTDTNGLNLSGTPTITSLSNGDFELSVAGGSMVTVASSTINANAAKQIMGVRFATSTGISSGYNVAEIESATTTWWFRNGSGNYYGESFDNDPGGNPGQIKWDDSGISITVSGVVYEDQGATPATTTCATASVVKVKVTGGSLYSGNCSIIDGTYSIPGVSFSGDVVLTAYLDTNGGAQAAVVTKTPTADVTLDLYQHRTVVRHEDTSPMTIADMAGYNSSDDSDIPFTASAGSPDTLTLPSDTELLVADGKTFAPGGNVTLQGGGSGAVYDGRLHLDDNSTFTAIGSESHTVAGNFQADAGATFTPANSTLTFTATTTGKTILGVTAPTFYNMTFDGAGGDWSLNSAVTVSNTLTPTAGTITGTGSVTVNGATVSGNGAFTMTGGTFTLKNGGNFGGAANWKFYNLNLGDGVAVATTTKTGANTIEVSNILTVAASHTVKAQDSTWVLSGAGTPFAVNGTFTADTSLFKYSGTSATNITAADYNKLELSPSAAGSPTYTLLSGTLSIADAFTAGDGVNPVTVTANTNDPAVTVSGNFTISTSTTFIASNTAAFSLAGNYLNTGTLTPSGGTVTLNAATTGKTITPGASPFANLTLNNSAGGWTITGNATTTGNFTLASSTSFTQNSGTTLEVGGTFTNSVGGAATAWTGSTLYLNSGTSFAANQKTDASDTYDTLKIGANTKVSLWNSSASTVTMNSTGSLYSQNHAAVSGNVNIYGAYTRSSGSDYWSYAKDFDGTAATRQVNVKFASSSSAVFSGGTLEILGTAAATTTIDNQGTGKYALAVSGGTLNAQYYQIRNTDTNGLNLSGTPTITSLSNGDFELSVAGGSMVTVESTTISQNASMQISSVRFATSTGIASGYDVSVSGTSVNAWTFQTTHGNYDGEAFDNDGGDACGQIRWSDSVCLLVDQSHYRWRNDDGGEGVPAASWYDENFSRRKKIRVINATAGALTNVQVKLAVTYDADMQSDFDDLRFTDSTGTTSINYFIESYIASATSTVWIKVPSLPASGSADIYMYYGDATVSTTGSASNTFVFYDGMEDNGITEYSGDASLFRTTTSFNYEWSYGLASAVGSEGAKTTDGIYRTGASVAQGQTIRYFDYIDTSTGSDDEVCTLFGVQSPGANNNNYAVCLEVFGTDHVALVKNVSSNDSSGTSLASKNVTFATGWYEVEVDWKNTNVIDVSVYDNTGALFATTTATDGSYTSGGVGFAFWGQHGGWDYYTSRVYASSDPTYAFGFEQQDGGATWKTAEDTLLNNQTVGSNVRLRFTVANTGPQITSQEFRLQSALKGASANCESVPSGNFTDVPTETAGCGTGIACMATSTITNQSSTGELLTGPSNSTFAAGQIMEDPSNETTSMTLNQNYHTEVEYNFKLTNYASGAAYCFRTTNAGTALDSYTHVAEVGLLHMPVISNFKFNNDANIALTEGTTKLITATASTTDQNGYADMLYATSTFYRSGVGATCSANDNNCYQVASTSCTLSDCSGNTCNVTCSANVEYFADPTDAGTYSAENWLANMTVVDGTDLKDTDTSVGVEMYTLRALGTVDSIDYGALAVGSDTGGINASTTLTNTGNDNINISLDGTNLTSQSSTSTIAVDKQKYATTSFTYGACAICQFLTGTTTVVDVNLPKPTTTAPVSDRLYWGISVPVGTRGEQHLGTNTFIATGG